MCSVFFLVFEFQLKVIVIHSNACLRIFNLVWIVMLLFSSALFGLEGVVSFNHLKCFDPHAIFFL